jgi:homoserine kinase type II
LAQIHLASADFPLTRANTMGFAHNLATLEACGEAGLASINPALPAMLPPAQEAAAIDMDVLPQAQIHADLFPDNVLMLGDSVTGLIDFYFACTGPMALDLAVTHASWSFDFYNKYQPEIGAAIIEGYESVRPLTGPERAALPAIAKGATLRFVASRAEDWLDTPDDALVVKKDPMQMVARWKVYEDFGAALFA